MENTYRQWRQKIDSVPPEDVDLAKSAEFKGVRVVFNRLHQLISQLPQNERDRVLVALAKDLEQLGTTFTAGIMTQTKSAQRQTDRVPQTSDDLVGAWCKLVREDFGLASLL